MAILYRTDGAWGSGKGVNLVPAEVDENFFDVDQRIEYLQDNPPEAITPVAISIEGGLFTMQMSDGSTLGPIVMTMPVPQWRGDWQPAMPYQEMDFFVAPDGGMGAVMISHTSAATFDWAALSGGLPVYKQMTGASGTTSGLADLIDVAIAGAAADDLLVYNLAASLWQNKTKTVVATTVLPAFGGDAGSGGTQGMVPAPATGDAAAGKVLGAAGTWVVPAGSSGSGTVTSVATSGGVTGGPITTSGTISLSPIATLTLLANLTGSSAAPTAATLSAILDAVIGSSRGSLLRRGAGVWSALPPGTAGDVLTTGGAGADPTWAAAAGGGAALSVSDTAPAGAADSSLWFDSAAGQTYLRYNDGTSTQWVPVTNQPGPAGATGATGSQGPAGATGSQGIQGPAGSANMSGMTAGQIPVAATATSVTSSIPTTTFVARAGDTITGNLTIAPAAGNATLNFDTVAGASIGNALFFKRGGLTRWDTVPAYGAESGSNSGSDYSISRYNDAGSWISYALQINRATSNAIFTGTVTANGVLLTSDADLKTDIEPLGEALPLVVAVQPKSFRWQDGDDTRHSGFLAQDLAEIDVPGIVEGKPGDGLAADVGAMIAVLWQAVRELSAQVQALEAAK